MVQSIPLASDAEVQEEHWQEYDKCTYCQNSDKHTFSCLHCEQKFCIECLVKHITLIANEPGYLEKNDDGKGTIVLKWRGPHKQWGPYAYRVKWIPAQNGVKGHQQWHYLGRVAT